MGRVLTNNISLQVAREEPGTIGTLPVAPDWKLLEPNSLNELGANISTVARAPINKNRQRRKGTTTDLDSAVEFEADMTLDSLADFLEGFVFARAVNYDVVFNEADATGTGYTIASATAAQAAKLQYTSGGPISLLYARGYTTAANNGLKALNSDLGATDTEMTVSGLSAETAPASAIVEMAGIRPEEGDLSLTVAGTAGTLTSDNNSVTNAIDFTTLGWTVGQVIHIGGLTTGEQFSAGAGYARIVSIAANSVTLDRMDTTLASDTGAGETVDLLYGRFIRNVDVDATDYLETSYQFEAAFPNLGAGGATEYEYPEGNMCNQVAFNLPLTDKATAVFGFIGTDTPASTTTRKTNASSGRLPAMTTALNTTADVARLRIMETDETGLTTDFKNLTLSINNNVSPEKVVGTLGARYMNAGNFEIDIEAQVLFTSGDVTAAIRGNTTLAMDFRLKNDNGAVAVDIPSFTLSGGGRDYPVNESVTINVTGAAFADPTLDTSIGVSLFPVVP